jgi:hypothetical protein
MNCSETQINEANMRKKLALLLGAVVATGLGPAAAQVAPGQVYDEALRATLMQQGWKPDVSYGLKRGDGAPLYRYPEIVCGPQLCRAKWRNRTGAEQAIMIQRAYNDEPYRVAPQ